MPMAFVQFASPYAWFRVVPNALFLRRPWLRDGLTGTPTYNDNDNDNDNENKFIAKVEQQLHWTYISSIKSTLYEAEK